MSKQQDNVVCFHQYTKLIAEKSHWSSDKRQKLLARGLAVAQEVASLVYSTPQIELDVSEEGDVSLVMHSGANDYLVVPEDQYRHWTVLRNGPEGLEVLKQGVLMEEALKLQSEAA